MIKTSNISLDTPIETQNNFHTYPNSLQIELVENGSLKYSQGRELSKLRYYQIWDTKNLIDDNDYGIIVSYEGSVIGNVNLQIRQKNFLLKSEYFFAEEHWKEYLNIDEFGIAEISGLAISDKVPKFLSRPVLMLLILGLQSIQFKIGFRFYTTVQHKFLIRILRKNLKLPFFANSEITIPNNVLPDDKYWQRDELPKIYYIDGCSPKTINACASYFFYINCLGISTEFRSNLSFEDFSYSTFWKDWNSEKLDYFNKKAINYS